MSSLYIVIPAYNESENIEKTIDQWYPVVERHNDEGNSRLVIINDGSKDNTYELLQKCAATRPLLVPLDKPNGGHGPTVLYGYRYAIRQKADYIFQTDSDGQTNPDEFEPENDLRCKSFRRQCAVPPDEIQPGSQIYRQTPRRFQHPQHYVYNILRPLQRES